jgi:hypothetical protein
MEALGFPMRIEIHCIRFSGKVSKEPQIAAELQLGHFLNGSRTYYLNARVPCDV